MELEAHSIALDVNQDLAVDFGEFVILQRCEVVNVMKDTSLMWNQTCKPLHIVEGLQVFLFY